MRNLARSLVFDDNVADDVVQETWLAVLRNPPETLGSAKAWLARVVRNFAHRMTRDQGRRERRESLAARDEAVPSAAEMRDRDAARRAVIEAADRLAEPFRETILLRFAEGLPPREIARRHGVPVETVRSRVRLARERLRHELDAEYGDRRAWSLALLPLAAMPVAPGGTGVGSSGIGAPSVLGRAAREVGRIASRAASVSSRAAGFTAIGGLVALLTFLFLLTTRDRAPEHEATQTSSTDAIVARAELHETSTSDIGLESTRNPRSVDGDRLRAVAPPATGMLDIRTILETDGSPVGNVRIDIARASLVDPFEALLSMQSDASGIASIELPVGEYGVQLFHEAWSAIAVGIAENESSAVELRVSSRPRTVHGVVLDPQGRPVPDASLWTYSDALEGRSARVESVTATDGRFTLEGMIDTMLVGARTDSHAPSSLRQVGRVRGATPDRPLLLRVGPPGGRAELRVETAAGSPVADASVDFGHSPLNHVASPVEPTAAFRLRSDPEGVVVSPALAPGFCAVTIRSPGYAPRIETLEIRAGNTTSQAIVLTRGSTVSGRIVDSSGHPAAGATVEIVEPALVAFHTTTTAADGSYHVEGLAGGDTFFTCSTTIDGRFESVIESRFVPRDDAVEWSPRLEAPRPIAGHIVDTDGRPLAGCRVTITNETYVHDRESTTTDESGAFHFGNPTAPSYRLDVQAPARAPAEPTAAQPVRALGFHSTTGIRPGSDAMRIELAAHGQSGDGTSIVGTALLADRRLATESIKVELRHATVGAIATSFLARDGSFRIDGVPPADYELAFVDETLPYTAAVIRLTIADTPGMLRDLGDVELAAPGSLEVRFAGLADDDAATLRVTLSGLDADDRQRLSVRGFDTGDLAARADRLRPGFYTLRVESERFVTHGRELTIESGESLAIDVGLTQGCRVMLRLVPPNDATNMPSTRIVVRDRLGKSISDHRLEPGPFGRESLSSLVLPPGRYEVEAHGDDGSSATHVVELGRAEIARMTCIELPLAPPR